MAGVMGRPSSKWTGQTEKFKLMFPNHPSLAAAAQEKELRSARGCLSFGEQEEERQQLPQLPNQRATVPLHAPKLYLTANAWIFLEKVMRKREECHRQEARALAEEEVLRPRHEGHVGYCTILAKV